MGREAEPQRRQCFGPDDRVISQQQAWKLMDERGH
jgi:hypothetical protein